MADSQPDPRSARGRRIAVAAAVTALVLLVLGGIQVARLHQDYGTWGLWAGANPPRMTLHGRTYTRDGTTASVPSDATVELGSAPGGGRVFSAPTRDDAAPTVLFVRYPGGSVTAYELSGGP